MSKSLCHGDTCHEIEELQKELQKSQETIDNLLNDVKSWQVKYEKANKTIERLKACANVREFTDLSHKLYSK